MDEKLSINKVDDQFSISYHNYDEDVIEYFDAKGLQGGGYTWEALVRAALEMEMPSAMDQIKFDPEGDAFFAYANDQSTAEAVKKIFEKLTNDVSYRQKCIDKAEAGGYLE